MSRFRVTLVSLIYKDRNLVINLATKMVLFLMIYIAITVVFAFAYYSLKRSFFHHNPLYDPAYYEIKTRVTTELCNSVFPTKVLNAADGFCIYEINGDDSFDLWGTNGPDKGKLKAVTIQVGEASDKNLKVFIHYHIQFASNTTKNLGPTGGSGDIFVISLDEINEFGNEMSLKVIAPDSVFTMNPPIERNGSQIYTQFFKNRNLPILKNLRLFQNSNGLFLVLPHNKEIYLLSKYLKNTPVEEPSFWKMLYFSSMTISSFGFGEIVPISYAARIYVVIEVILGILLFGFFVAVLYDELKNYHQEKHQIFLNTERRKSIGALWKNYYTTFRRSSKMITQPLSEKDFDIKNLRFSMLQNLYFENSLNTMAPMLQMSFEDYFNNLEKITAYFKSVISSFDYEKNKVLIEKMTAAIAEIEKYDFLNALRERARTRVGNKIAAEVDIERFKNNPDIEPTFLPSNSINVYVGIWHSLITLNDLLSEIDAELNPHSSEKLSLC
ncbi:potassium channel family protein [Bdellovibrio sp. HCB-162]|uniref:potassium channel family protein n=1 Tax=Bdellovibrio sp. HCB-162 TaxID=3394234 RepID=UPI0039BD1799